MVVRPRSKVSRRFSRGVNVVYGGLGGSVVEGGGFGGVAGSEGSWSGACILTAAFNNIIYYGHGEH